MPPKKKKTNRNVVSFELADDMSELLGQDAKARCAKSLHIHARDIVVQGLSHKCHLATWPSHELDAKVAGLKTMMQRQTYAVLVYIAKIDPKDANARIREHLAY